MARSILPSRTAWAAKMRPLIHRAARRGAKVELQAICRAPELWHDGEDPADDLQRDIGPMVRGRRGGDKLHHFERWAVERTREMPAEQRLDYLAAVLPPGVIGEHALGHLESNPELMSDEQYARRFPRAGWRYQRPRAFLDRGLAAVLLRRVVESGEAHRELNRRLKALVADEQARNRRRLELRVLLGVHDVLPFLRALERWKLQPLKQVVDAFLRELWRRLS